MAGYGIAVQQGVQLGTTLALGKDSPAAIAAYNTAYNAQISRYNAEDARLAAEKNIASIRSDRLIQDQNIQLTQNTVEAQIRTQAAWAGAEGGSVEATVYETKSAEERRKADNKNREEQQKEGQVTAAGDSYSKAASIQDRASPSLGTMLLAEFSNYNRQDFNDLGTLMRGTPTKGGSDFGTEGISLEDYMTTGEY